MVFPSLGAAPPRPPLLMAAQEGHLEVLRQLLDAQVWTDGSGLDGAARSHRIAGMYFQ